ncbi:MAG: hypothetical protein QM736_17995 [Vicinamibacterales bacterium]
MAAATGRASSTDTAAAAATDVTPEDAEKRQSIWWYSCSRDWSCWSRSW